MKNEIFNRKGIIMAGGNGTRLYPITKGLNKHLIPLYDKPMIYYPLSILMLLGIRDILIITTNESEKIYKSIFGSGEHIGLNLNYQIQKKPQGVADAFLLGANFLQQSDCVLILGDNFFYGDKLVDILKKVNKNRGATIFAYPVNEPSSYGVIEFDKNYKILNIQEKPNNPKSRFAITGLYFLDKNVSNIAEKIKPSSRGELEMTSIINHYHKKNLLNFRIFGRGITWLDTGTIDDLHEASSFVRTLEHRQGLKIACIEEVAWRNGWISDNQLLELYEPIKNTSYGKYLLRLLDKDF